MIIQIDTREKPQAIEKIIETFDACGISYYRSKLYAGDYVDIDNMYFVIDRKQGLEEFSQNLTSNHYRFRNEVVRANNLGIRICVLIENDYGIASIDDVHKWVNPRLSRNPKAVKGDQLEKTMRTMMLRYDIYYEFCSPEEAGYKIIDLLEKEKELHELDRNK